MNSFRIEFLIHDVERLTRQSLDRRFKALGICWTQFCILAELQQAGAQGSCITRISQRQAASIVVISRSLDRLELRGLIEKIPHEFDRRSKRCRLTSAGEELMRTLTQIAERFVGEATQGIDTAAIETTKDALVRIKDRLNRDRYAEQRSVAFEESSLRRQIVLNAPRRTKSSSQHASSNRVPGIRR